MKLPANQLLWIWSTVCIFTSYFVPSFGETGNQYPQFGYINLMHNLIDKEIAIILLSISVIFLWQILQFLWKYSQFFWYKKTLIHILLLYIYICCLPWVHHFVLQNFTKMSKFFWSYNPYKGLFEKFLKIFIEKHRTRFAIFRSLILASCETDYKFYLLSSTFPVAI